MQTRDECKTVSNSPNPSRVYIRLCKHERRFLLLNYYIVLCCVVLCCVVLCCVVLYCIVLYWLRLMGYCPVALSVLIGLFRPRLYD